MNERKDQLDDVLKECQERLKQNPEDRAALVNLVGYYLKNNNIEKSREVNSKLLSLYPDDYHGVVNRGLIYILEHTPKLAEKEFKKAVKIDPEKPEAYYNLAELAFDLHRDSDIAKYYYKKLLEIDPDNYTAMNKLASIYYQTDKKSECIKLLEKAYRIKNDDREIINDIGLFYLREKQFSVAETYFNRLIGLYKDWRGYYHLGIISLKSGFVDLAIENFRKAIRLNPDEPALMNDYAFSLIKSFETRQRRSILKKAMKIISKVLKIRSEFPSALMNYGVILEYSGKIDEAIRCYEKLLSITPENVPAMINCALLIMNHKQNYKKSSSMFEKALTLDPYNHAARYNYGISLYREGYKVRAILELKRIVDAAPRTQLAQYAKELMAKINN